MIENNSTDQARDFIDECDKLLINAINAVDDILDIGKKKSARGSTLLIEIYKTVPIRDGELPLSLATGVFLLDDDFVDGYTLLTNTPSGAKPIMDREKEPKKISVRRILQNIHDHMDITPDQKQRIELYLEYKLPELPEPSQEEREQHAAKIVTKEVQGIDYPLDKINSDVWTLFDQPQDNGQLRIGYDLGRRGNKERALCLYSIDFSALEEVATVTRALDPFDKRVMIISAALYNAGNDVTSVSRIYRLMGGKGRPDKASIQKINDSLTKQSNATLYIDNDYAGYGQETEVKQQKGRKTFRYDGKVLPLERVSAYIDGQFTDAAIHFFREPPLVTFARDHKQLTTCDPILLQSPVNKTLSNLMIDDYLIEQIAHMKNSKKFSRKMLFATIFEHCKITTKKQRQRAPEIIGRFLDHYKSCDFIRDYTREEDGIRITL